MAERELWSSEHLDLTTDGTHVWFIDNAYPDDRYELDDEDIDTLIEELQKARRR